MKAKLVKESIETYDPSNVEDLERLVDKYRSAIYRGIKRLGTEYFGDSHTGFVLADMPDVSFGVLDTDEADVEDRDEPIVDDAYYLGAIFDLDREEVLELPGYRELEYEQMTLRFVDSFYEKNKNRFLVSYDASMDDISVISKPKKPSI